MANMIINMTVTSVAFGLNGALETLVSQAYGARELSLCGVYLNRSRLIITIFFLPLILLLINTSSILK